MLQNTLFIFILLVSSNLHAKGVYQEPASFINESFSNNSPEPSVYWLNDDVKKQIEIILQHKYQGRRIRYWVENQRSVWILDEIGKKKPITTGIVIENNKIKHLKVLVFRETRGWEVRHSFFTNQFIDAHLTNNNKLNQYIDGISGATLSVRALTKLARIALLLHKEVMQ